jgi:predicted peroxiredoxin
MVSRVSSDGGSAAQPSLMYVGTHGPEDPTRACMPFALAVATVDAGMGAIVHLRGDAVGLLRRTVLAAVAPIDMPPLREPLAEARDHAIPVYV